MRQQITFKIQQDSVVAKIIDFYEFFFLTIIKLKAQESAENGYGYGK
jgi:hypothetical protein